MNNVRQLPGLVLALALASVGAAQMLVAWAGWADRFGWPWALVAMVLSWFGGFNAFAVAGAFFFAQDYLHWSLGQSIALAAVGLMFGTAGIMRSWVSFLVGGRYTPDR
ncbi:hypothetical protein [Sandarakinorhabdus sp.]|uniref:hypothetical protein n=1 Tax=Sandarakinorhabdus sp. TaxID=1916663 RepID=UPI00334148CA